MTNLLSDINYDPTQSQFLNEKFGCGKTEARQMLKTHGLLVVLNALKQNAMCFENPNNYFNEEQKQKTLDSFKVVKLINDELFEHKIGTHFVDLGLNPFEEHCCVVEIQSGKIYNGFHSERFEPAQLEQLNLPSSSLNVKSLKFN